MVSEVLAEQVREWLLASCFGWCCFGDFTQEDGVFGVFFFVFKGRLWVLSRVLLGSSTGIVCFLGDFL